LEILHILQHGNATVNQLADMTGIPQATVSQHLSVLRRLRLVTSIKEAQMHRYKVASEHVSKIIDAMRRLLLERYGVKTPEKLDDLQVFTDPVCGMEIAAHQAAATLVHNQERYYFCGLGCEAKFKESL
jgi:YHS domain-containing protein/predicted transcriptional regulator